MLQKPFIYNMSEIKVRLSITVPGAGMLSSQECEKNPKESYNVTKLLVKNGRGKNSTELITVATRKNKTAKQSISITKEAYDYMVSNEFNSSCSSLLFKYPKHVWLKMTPKQRLEAHLSIIAESFNAIGFTYEVLDD